jgi:amidophosphoribosyltransferase
MMTKETFLQTGPQEACGITAVFSKKDLVISPLVPVLQSRLHHRGRDSAGMASYDHQNATITVYKDTGSVRDAFKGKLIDGELVTDFDFALHNLLSDRAIGHNRYGTSGDEEKDSLNGAQPIIVSWEGKSLALAFNGTIPERERQLLQTRIPEDMHAPGNFDTVDIAQAIVSAHGETWEERIQKGLDGIGGAYSLTILTDEGDVFGLRGPSGTWPLWIGETDESIFFSSESIIDDSSDVSWSEVHAGELVKATRQGVERKQLLKPLERVSRCSLHDVYGAKPDSLMTENIRYRQFRELVGRQLAKEYPLQADVYAGVPNTGVEIAQGFSQQLNVPLTSVFRIADGAERSYIAQDPEAAIEIIKGKFLLQDPALVRDKSIVLIEDSIIKGSTMGGDPDTHRKGIIKLLKDVGAAEVHVLLALPTFVDDCDQGYYIRKPLLAALKREADGEYRNRDVKEIAQYLGADSVHYISVTGLKTVYKKAYGGQETACMACMGEPHPLRRSHEPLPKRSGNIFAKTAPYVIDNKSSVDTMVTVE